MTYDCNIEGKKQITRFSYFHKSILNFHTFALGFSVDLSEDNEPTEELGERPGPEGAAKPPTRSEPDDAELPGLPREFTDFVSSLTLPEAEVSITSLGDPVFS